MADKPRTPMPKAELTEAFLGVPGVMGYSNLETPDDAFDALKFKVNTHHTDAQKEALKGRLHAKVIEVLWPKFLASAEKLGTKAPRGGWEKPDADAWVEDHLKDPKEGFRIETPYITWSNDAEYRDKKSGEMRTKAMRAYDPSGQMLDLKALKLGMGSTIQPVLKVSIFSSPGIDKGKPGLSFKLQGVRVLNLIQWGGGGGNAMGEMDEDDAALAGLDAADLGDMSAYVKRAEEKPQAEPRKAAPAADTYEDLDDEIPF